MSNDDSAVVHKPEGQIQIMIIDDDHFLLDMYALKFQKAGLFVDTAPGSTAALSKLREGQTPDIILLDIIMPTMDGLEMLQIVRNEKLVPNSTIVMLTNQPDEMDKAQKLGVDGYIVKATTIPSEVVTQVLDIYKHKKSK
ncbi:MAG: two-component system, OmpR family, response regulator [Patescibacteria group bacterium]|nr:two-component system, OmpR family, response regulator [Patescibacteria group bacterium]